MSCTFVFAVTEYILTYVLTYLQRRVPTRIPTSRFHRVICDPVERYILLLLPNVQRRRTTAGHAGRPTNIPHKHHRKNISGYESYQDDSHSGDDVRSVLDASLRR